MFLTHVWLGAQMQETHTREYQTRRKRMTQEYFSFIKRPHCLFIIETSAFVATRMIQLELSALRFAV
jgi:hypothetical protein